MKVYVLIGEYGEYESHTTTVLGVFLTEDDAQAAITMVKPLSEQQYARYEEHQTSRKEYLKRFSPDKVYPSMADDPTSPFPDGCVLYRNDQYAEADAAVGPAPDFIIACDEYRVEAFELGALGPPPRSP